MCTYIYIYMLYVYAEHDMYMCMYVYMYAYTPCWLRGSRTRGFPFYCRLTKDLVTIITFLCDKRSCLILPLDNRFLYCCRVTSYCFTAAVWQHISLLTSISVWQGFFTAAVWKRISSLLPSDKKDLLLRRPSSLSRRNVWNTIP